MVRHRARLFLLVLGVTAAAAMTGAFVPSAPAGSPPSVAGQASLINAPNALACNGTVKVRVTLTGTAGVDGVPTDVVLVLDRSGSMADTFGNGPATTELVAAARAFIAELDAADGVTNDTFGNGNKVGIVTYGGGGASILSALTNNAASVSAAVDDVAANGSSPHGAGINKAVEALSDSVNKAMIVISDGIGANGTEADAAKSPGGVRVASIGVGTGKVVAALTAWATPGPYQDGSGGINTKALVNGIGAAVSVPAAFTLTETPGTNFSLGGANSGGIGTVGGPGLTWSGSLANGQIATLEYTATRNGSSPFAVTTETISSSALTVTGGSGSVVPATRTIDVLPCDAGTLITKQTCTGAACGATGSTNGVSYSLNAGTPAAGTEIYVSGLTSTPPAGACPGFDTNVNGVQIDIRPLTTPGNFEIRIPKAALGGKKWWQTDVCVATNLKFITKIGSLANLRPGALNSGDRWWGLLPSVPRYVYFAGLGWVKGPSVTFRGPGATAGDAVIRFTIPYAGENSKNFMTNGLPGYDPRAWGG